MGVSKKWYAKCDMCLGRGDDDDGMVEVDGYAHRGTLERTLLLAGWEKLKIGRLMVWWCPNCLKEHGRAKVKEGS